MNTLQDVSGGTKWFKFRNKSCKNVYEINHITYLRHYETTLQLASASRRNITICCKEKICINEINGLENRAK